MGVDNYANRYIESINLLSIQSEYQIDNSEVTNGEFFTNLVSITRSVKAGGRIFS